MMRDECNFSWIFFYLKCCVLRYCINLWYIRHQNFWPRRILNLCISSTNKIGNPILKFHEYCSGYLKNIECQPKSSLTVLLPLSITGDPHSNISATNWAQLQVCVIKSISWGILYSYYIHHASFCLNIPSDTSAYLDYCQYIIHYIIYIILLFVCWSVRQLQEPNLNNLDNLGWIWKDKLYLDSEAHIWGLFKADSNKAQM